MFAIVFSSRWTNKNHIFGSTVTDTMICFVCTWNTGICNTCQIENMQKSSSKTLQKYWSRRRVWAEFVENWFGAASPVGSLFAPTHITFLLNSRFAESYYYVLYHQSTIDTFSSHTWTRGRGILQFSRNLYLHFCWMPRQWVSLKFTFLQKITWINWFLLLSVASVQNL